MKKEYKMIVVSNEIAGFSEDIITKYNRDKVAVKKMAKSSFWI